MKQAKQTATQQSPAALWGVIGSLYITQGIPMGVTFGALPAILRYESYSTEIIGLLGLVMIPWALKFLWAPLVDRHSGGSYQRRRGWIIPIQVIQTALLMAIALLPHENGIGPIVLALLFAANLASATQDIATDGLAIEIIPKGKFGWVNSAQIGGFAVGMILGGSMATALYAQGGWPLCFGILSLITLLTIIPLLRYQGGSNDLNQTPVKPTAEAASLVKFFNRKGAFYIISIAASFYFGRAMIGSMTSPFLVDAGLSLNTIALISGIGITVITIVSAGFGGWVVNFLGAQKAAVSAGFCATLAMCLWLLPSYLGYTSLGAIIVIVLINGLLSGVAYVAFFTIFMQWASSEQAGTDFSLLQSSETISNIMAMLLGGIIASTIGFSGNFLAAAGVALLLMFWITFALMRMKVVSNQARPTLFNDPAISR